MSRPFRHFLFYSWCAFCVLMIAVNLTGCATLGVDAPKTFNEKVAVALSTVTIVRDTTISLLTADHITAEDAENIQTQANNARNGIDIARQLHATNPGPAENRLDAAVTILKALEDYLRGRQ